MGYKTVGFDINPMAILATKAKTHCYTEDEILLISKYIESFQLPSSRVEIEAGKVIQTSFTEDVLDILLKIRYFVESIRTEFVQAIFRLALISLIPYVAIFYFFGFLTQLAKFLPAFLIMIPMCLQLVKNKGYFSSLDEADQTMLKAGELT